MIVNLSQQWFLLPAAKRHGFAELYVKKGNLWILVDCSFIICLELLLQIMRIFISFYTILNKSGIFWNVFKFDLQIKMDFSFLFFVQRAGTGGNNKFFHAFF